MVTSHKQIFDSLFLFGKMVSLLWQICDIIGQIVIDANGQIFKINLTITLSILNKTMTASKASSLHEWKGRKTGYTKFHSAVYGTGVIRRLWPNG